MDAFLLGHSVECQIDLSIPQNSHKMPLLQHDLI